MKDNNSNDIILSLDVSTTTIGICLLEDDGSEYGKILELTHINPKPPRKTNNEEKIYIKKKMFKEFIQKYKDLNITNVIIEEPLMRSNNILTVSVLLRFNGMISDCIYEELGVVPQYISSYDARKYSFPELMSIRKYGKNEQQYPFSKIEKEIKEGKFVLFGSYPWMIDKKVVIQEKVSEIFPNVTWIYNKNGELKKENYDASDAYVAVLGWLNKKRYGELNFESELIEESNDGNGSVEITYNVKYWDKCVERKTYVNV